MKDLGIRELEEILRAKIDDINKRFWISVITPKSEGQKIAGLFDGLPFAFDSTEELFKGRENIIMQFGEHDTDNGELVGAIYGTEPYKNMPALDQVFRNGKLPIAFVAHGVKTGFWPDLRSEIYQVLRVAKEEKYSFLFYYPIGDESDWQSQIKIIKEKTSELSKISSNSKIMFVAVGNHVQENGELPQQLEEALDHSRDKGINLVLLSGKQLNKKYEKYQRIWIDQSKAGTYAASIAADIAKRLGKVNVGIIVAEGKEGSFSYDRRTGALPTLKKLGLPIDIIKGDWTDETSYKEMQNLMKRKSEILSRSNIVIAYNETMLAGLVRALKDNANFKIGMDGTKWARLQLDPSRKMGSRVDYTVDFIRPLARSIVGYITKMTTSKRSRINHDVDPKVI